MLSFITASAHTLSPKAVTLALNITYTIHPLNRVMETMERDIFEKRVSKRYAPSIYVNIFDASTNKFIGLIVDLSKTGFKLSSQNQLTVNQPYHLAIKNPFEGPNSPLLPFVVKALWSRQREDGLHETGFEFVDLGKESEALFIRLNEDFESIANLTGNTKP